MEDGPATAGVFWVAAGACLGRAGGGREWALPRRRWPIAVAGDVVVVGVGVMLWRPALLKARHASGVVASLSAGDVGGAAWHAERAAEADPLDAIAAADAARAILTSGRGAPGEAGMDALRRAGRWAGLAIERDPAQGGTHRSAGRIAWDLARGRDRLYAWYRLTDELDELERRVKAALRRDPTNPALLSRWASLAFLGGDNTEALRRCRLALQQDPRSSQLHALVGNAAWRLGLADEARRAWRDAARSAPTGAMAAEALGHMAAAVRRDPTAARLRVDLADMLCAAGRGAEALEHLDAAKRIDRALFPGSLLALTRRERAEADLLEARAKARRRRPPDSRPAPGAGANRL